MTAGLGLTTVDVVIATYRRPDRLAVGLSRLKAAAAAAPPGWRVGVTVVDDDPAGSAHPVAAQFADAFSAGVTYLSCGARNISLARNMGLESALKKADWVGSLDDDVEVSSDWVRVCAAAVSETPFNAVTGPLLKDFPHGPAWLSDQPFDQLGILAGRDGEAAFTCATGNNWVEADFLRSHPSLRFSPDLGRTGGEDMEFFYRAVQMGLRPVFIRAGAVIEREPPSRCTYRYQLRRAYWLGVSEAQISLRLGKASRPRLLARSLRRALSGGARQLPAHRLAQRGARYRLAVGAQCLGVVLGTAGMRMRHK